MTTNILCLDLALTNTGYVVAAVQDDKDNIIEVGTIRTPASSAKQAKATKQTVGEMDWGRSNKLAQELHNVILRQNIKHVYVECPTGGSKSSRAAKAMALAKGTAAAVCSTQQLPATLFTPQHAKRAATGSPNATKDEVKTAILKEFSYYDGWIRNTKGKLVQGQNEHIFDACSVLMSARRTKSYKEFT